MDLGTAIPISVGIVMAGIALMNFFHKKNGNPGIGPFVAEKLCDERYDGVEKRLGRGVERFDKIDDKLDEQGKIIASMDTKLDLLVEGKVN